MKVLGLFNDTKRAGEAVSELKQISDTDEVAVLTKEYNEQSYDADKKLIKNEVDDGAKTGAGAGAAVGGILGLLAGTTAITIPGVGIATGWLAATLIGAAEGGVVGGIAGALVDYGVDSTKVEEYEDAMQAGQVLVGVDVEDEGNVAKIGEIFERYGCDDMDIYHEE